MTNLRKALVLIFGIAVMLGLSVQASAAQKYYLPSKIQYFSEGGGLLSTQTFSYDKNRNISKVKTVYTGSNSTNIKSFKYSKFIGKIRKEGIVSFNGKENLHSYYNRNGFVIKIFNYNDNCITEQYSYDSKGYRTSRTDYFGNKTVYHFTYYSDGTPKTRKGNDGTDDHFNKKGYMYKENLYYHGHDNEVIHKYTYYKNGLPKTITTYKNGAFLRKVKYTYTKMTTKKAMFMYLMDNPLAYIEY